MRSGGKKERILLLISALCAAVLLINVLYPLRNVMMSCSDSLAEFIFARTSESSRAYVRGLEFCLARGRIGFIFPLVTAFRLSVFRSGSFTAMWLLQYVPIVMNIALISFLIARRTKPVYGIFFASLFLSLLQVTGWHSLIICYPLDFMYGLFISVLSMWFYDISLTSSSGRKRFIFLILSIFLYYESMQVYEAFLFTGIVYLWISLSHRKEKEDGILHRFIDVVPHLAAAVCYIGIFLWISAHPVTDMATNDITTIGTAGGFAVTLASFSGGMLPGIPLLSTSVREGIKGVSVTPLLAVAAFTAAAAVLVTCLLIFRDKDAKKYNAKLFSIGISGVITAVFFPVMHAATKRYQDWVLIGKQPGYVPTVICYFGWTVAAACFLCILMNILSGKKKSVRITAVSVSCVLFFFMTILTGLINRTIMKNDIGPSSPMVSLRAQAFYELCDGSELPSSGCELMYLDGYSGVHGDVGYNRMLMENMTGYGKTPLLTTSESEFAGIVDGYAYPYIFRYDADSDTGLLIPVTRKDDEGRLFSSGRIIIYSAHGGGIEVTVTDLTGNKTTVSLDTSGKRESVVELKGETAVNGGIDVSAKP